MNTRPVPHRRASAIFSQRRRSGFTVAEVLVAVLIIVAALTMGTTLLERSAKAAAKSRQLTAASLVARAELGRMMESSYSDLMSSGFDREGKTTQGGIDYAWSANVEDTEQGMALIELTVSWESREQDFRQSFVAWRRT